MKTLSEMKGFHMLFIMHSCNPRTDCILPVKFTGAHVIYSQGWRINEQSNNDNAD